MNAEANAYTNAHGDGTPRKSDHTARKRFGQNFLADEGVAAAILSAIAPRPGEHVVEIGPGQGALTFPLLERIGALTAIELDRDLARWLRKESPRFGTLELIEADALTVDLGALRPSPLRIVGNLPYNISTPMLFHALTHADAITDMHFMLQREVVDRMAAAPGSKTYGRLSVMLQARCRIEALLAVPSGAFRPAPKVESAVVRLVPLPAADIADTDFAALDRVVRAGFGMRRKTLHNALAGLIGDSRMRALGVDPAARAETLPVSSWLALADEWAAHAGERAAT